jgi:hypothetical protein
MKSILVFLLAGVLVLQSHGQSMPFTFSLDSAVYQNLSAPTSLNNGQVWNNQSSYPLNFGFPFEFDGLTYTSCTVMGGGEIQFTGCTSGHIWVYRLGWWGDILKDRGTATSLSPISYEITGGSGNHILKVEWLNAGIGDAPNCTYPTDPADFTNFQVWLYEGSGKIEYHYGPSHSTAASFGYGTCGGQDGPAPGILICSGKGVGFFGPADNPTPSYQDCNFPCIWFVSGNPPDSIIYIFNPDHTFSIADSKTGMDIQLYPNPVTDQLHVNVSNTSETLSLELLDLAGHLVLYRSFTGSAGIDLSNVAAGMYVAKIKTGAGTVQKKITVER